MGGFGREAGAAPAAGSAGEEPPLRAGGATGEARAAQLREEIAQVGFRRARLSRACEHGVAIGARRLLGLMLTICWRRLIATCQAAETRQVLTVLTGRPAAAPAEANAPAHIITRPAGQPAVAADRSLAARHLDRSVSLDSGVGAAGSAFPSWPTNEEVASPRGASPKGGALDSSQVQRCLDTITELQGQLRSAKRELRASQLREAEAVESGSVALMEAEELRARLAGTERKQQELAAELDRRRAKPGALNGLCAEDLRALAEELEAAASCARTAEAVAAAEAAALCPVCWAARRDMAFQCGHQTCVSCGKRLESCPICRSAITLRIQLF